MQKSLFFAARFDLPPLTISSSVSGFISVLVLVGNFFLTRQ